MRSATNTRKRMTRLESEKDGINTLNQSDKSSGRVCILYLALLYESHHAIVPVSGICCFLREYEIDSCLGLECDHDRNHC